MRFVTRATALIVTAAFFAGCGHGGSGTSTLPGMQNPSGLDRARQGAIAGPADTLYVSGNDRVSAFALSASGSTPPDRTIFPHEFQQDGVTGIATAADATLGILQDYQNSIPAPDCRVVQESSTANGTGPKLNQLECNTDGGRPGVRGRAIARGANFEIDILDSLSGTQVGDFVERTNFSEAPPFNTGSIGPLPGAAGTHHGIAVASGGHIYISSSSAAAPIVYSGSASTAGCSSSASGAATIDNYAPNAPSNASPVHTFTIVGRTAAGAMALSPDNTTLNVATCDLNGLLWIDRVATSGASGPVHPTRSIGPLQQNSVTALAVDAQGNLYVGLTATDFNTNDVRVYAPTAGSGKPTPLRILQNPVPTGSNNRITGLAISQSPYMSAPAPATVVYDSVPAGPLSSSFPSIGFQSNHELEFGDGVNLTQTGYLHSVSWILRSFGCQAGTGGAATCVTTPGATFAVPVTANVYALTGSGTHVGSLLATQTKTFNIPYRPSSDPTKCTPASGRFFDTVSQTCVTALGVRITLPMPSVLLSSPVIFTMTFNTQTFGYNPIGIVGCPPSAGCGYDQLNISASTLGGPVGSAYDPNSVFNSSATGTSTYEGGDCNPTPIYPANQLTLDNGCWGSTTDFPGGLHPQLQVTTR
jgi:hypothetical protein